MPMDLNRYPKNWRAIALQVKEAADWTCQNCDRPCRHPGETWDELEKRVENNWEVYVEIDTKEFGVVEVSKFNRFTLTVSHLNHNPMDCRPENLRALCSVCHLKYDARHHARSRSGNKLRRREAVGQLQLFS
ncbi:HNH endonuclease [Planktothrix tepida]|uniref:hypothetical protein n=1 Tax=Planktothrix tepida TaxID=1678309 RepID=UPI0009339372|nr:hypothetical protein [Planktothrix tepida]CAD5984941.1 HNH endonuclease [Planktothrix tepida]CAD5985217.1 HNH endonuclease [Planktothrix tepida]